MSNDDPKPTTYFHRSIIDLDAPGGRWAGPRPKVNGTAPTVEPLAAPEWSKGPQPGTEPPLGYSVESLERE
jgi:hypothetical protein